MKIAHIVCSYPPYYSGMGAVVFETVNELVKRGHTVNVFTPGIYGEEEIEPKEKIPLETHTAEITKEIETVRRLSPALRYGNAARLSQLKEELDGFDLVHLHYPFFGTAGMVRSWKRKHPDTPLVITYHMDTRAPGWKGLLFKLYAQYSMPKILSSADAIITSSFDYIVQSDARTLFEQYREKWIELPFGVDTKRFQPRHKPLELFHVHELDPQYPTVLFVGGMDDAHYFKGIPVLLKAARLMKQVDELPQIVLVGDGSLRDEFMGMAKGLGIHDSLRFVGHVPDHELPYYYNMADLLVLPSIHRGEAFGMVLLEAMASGVPVIASELPGVKTVAQDGGITVAPNDPIALSDAIRGYFLQSRDKEEWGRMVRDMAVEKYSWQLIVDRLEALYRELVEE